MTEYDDDDYENEEESEDDDREMKVGARVQKGTGDEDVAEPLGGVVESLEPAEKPMADEYWKCSEEELDTMKEHITIKWDDGSTERLQVDDVDMEDTEVERDFRKACAKAKKQIEKKLVAAAKALDEAEAIANKYGIPFHSGVSPLSQSYYPSSTGELYPDLDSEFIDSLSGAYHSEYGEEGWQHSSIC
jgi:hypothetical protein